MNHIIHERPRLSQCSHNFSYFCFLPLLISPTNQAGMACTTLTEQTHTKQAHPQKGVAVWVT